ncbi:MAG TPA: methylthioribulose 1-phosphate dehydratase [Nevskiaceae bacterium]|nr:methylthioribulose 1-phosphate dehydratase [Nevskiaceae bacterium]
MTQDKIAKLIEAGRLFHQRGWVPATGGNFSARVGPESLIITASGTHKGELTESDFLVADFAGRPEIPGRKASYETLLHCQLYRHHAQIGCVLHTHSVANTILSRRHKNIRLHGYELQKVLGVDTHESTLEVPVFANDQDIAALAARVDLELKERPQSVAYLIAGHGLYAWGADVAQTRYRIEALEFMFECELRS